MFEYFGSAVVSVVHNPAYAETRDVRLTAASDILHSARKTK